MKRKYIFFSKYCTVSGSPVCGSEELPEADFNFCAPDVRTSEIRRIFVGRVDGDDFADYSVAFEWLLRVSQTSNDKNALRPLMVIGDKPAPNSMRRQLSMERKQTVKKDHTINFTIDDVSAANHAFVEWMRSGKYMRLWYETTGRFMFGGNAGIVAYVNIDMVLPRGGGEIMTYQGTITWSNLRTEDRVISPIYDDVTGECGDVQNISLRDITLSEADVTWDSDPLAGAYQWAITESDTEPTTGITLTYDTTAHLSFLDPDTTYYVWVRAICNNGTIGAWRFQTFHTAIPSVCAKLTGVYIDGISEDSAVVLWDADSGVDNIISYNTTGIEPTPGDGTAVPNSYGYYEITGLTPGTHYFIYIQRACDDGSFSTWTVNEIHTDASSCSGPTIDFITGSFYFTMALDAGNPVILFHLSSDGGTCHTYHIEFNQINTGYTSGVGEMGSATLVYPANDQVVHPNITYPGYSGTSGAGRLRYHVKITTCCGTIYEQNTQ